MLLRKVGHITVTMMLAAFIGIIKMVLQVKSFKQDVDCQFLLYIQKLNNKKKLNIQNHSSLILYT